MTANFLPLLGVVVLGGIALVLAAVGIFGVISYSVTQRTRELGIRLAQGEDPGQSRRSPVLGGMRLVGLSLARGLVASLVLGRLIEGLLYQVRPAYPLIFSSASGRCSPRWPCWPAISPPAGPPGWIRRLRSGANDDDPA